ncbi:MAG: GNAT family N-acetyltransferase [Synergistaceae bacterium]|jgi:GNAT superfamily N-acetyltransferase|nr:GNAT family N-acetyltransferase [Synergistaceae bacterium]
MTFTIVPYGERHGKKGCGKEGFDCGNPALNLYLARYAGQDVRRHYAALFAAVRNDTDRIIGYYALSNASVRLRDVHEGLRRRLPKYPEIPAIRLGRLAVDKSVQRQGIGAELLGDAILRSLTNVAAWSVMAVDAKDEKARSFYLRFGFDSIEGDNMRLYAMRQDLEAYLPAGVAFSLSQKPHIII